MQVELPEPLRFLLAKKARYKVARGGRGSAKSWSFARALVLLAHLREVRVLCAREIQLSIKQSVHQLLKDQIELLGLQDFFTVYETTIRGLNGSRFDFSGLSGLTIDQIKSFEGYDYCWVEEGQTISKRSWDILVPTIRKEGSEIWISYNPELETDPTHKRFTINPPQDCINVLINWRDNPWFPAVLEKERLHCKATDPDNYDHIWEGQCKPAVEGAIYFKQVQEMERQNRLMPGLPYDPMLKVHVVFDVGDRDYMAVGMVQKIQSAMRWIDYFEGPRIPLPVVSEELRRRAYNWGKVIMPIDAFSTVAQSLGKSSAGIMRALGWNVVDRQLIMQYQMGIEDGINAVRTMFSQFYVDKEKCKDLVECWKRYRRHVNKNTEVVGTPMHDRFSHGADCTRYAVVNSDLMTNEMDDPFALHPEDVASYAPLDPYVGI